MRSIAATNSGHYEDDAGTLRLTPCWRRPLPEVLDGHTLADFLQVAGAHMAVVDFGIHYYSESSRTLATIVKKCSAKFRPLSLDMTCEIRLHSSVRSSRVILWRDSMRIFACRSFGLYMPFRVLETFLYETTASHVHELSRSLLICSLHLRPCRLLRTCRLQQMYAWSTRLYLRAHMLSLTFWIPPNLARVLIFAWIHDYFTTLQCFSSFGCAHSSLRLIVEFIMPDSTHNKILVDTTTTTDKSNRASIFR